MPKNKNKTYAISSHLIDHRIDLSCFTQVSIFSGSSREQRQSYSSGCKSTHEQEYYNFTFHWVGTQTVEKERKGDKEE